jgi:predicted AlkP superfamily phosphohydrolase/phosphomutase
MLLYGETDRMQHYLWADMEGGGEYKDAILNYYKAVDGQVGELVAKAGGENTTVFIISDHGFSRQKKKVYIDHYLKEEGVIHLKSNWQNTKSWLMLKLSGFLKKTGLNNQVVKLMVAFGGKPGDIRPPKMEVDWEKTTAHTCSYYTGQIYLNPKLNATEKEEVTRKLLEKLPELKDPETGAKIVKEVHRKEDIYHGDAMKEAPDVIIVPEDGYWIFGGFNYPELIQEGDRETGRHDLEGIIIVSGEGAEEGSVIENAQLIDVAPTVLDLFGIKGDTDGRPLKEALMPEKEETPVKQTVKRQKDSP